MRVGRTLPPAAVPIYINDIISGLKGLLKGDKEIQRFESELKQYFNVKHCFLVSSGKASLTIVLKALHELQPEKKEVLIPAYTCYSVPSAIVKAGLKIRLCDIDPDTLDFDFNQLEEIFTGTDHKSILAVLPTHLFGIPSNINRLKEMIRDYELFIVEDAAQAMGTTVKGKRLGTFGDVGFFSLGRGKALSTVEGGIILTNNNQIAEQISNQLKYIQSYNIRETLKLIIYSLILQVFMHPAFFWLPKSLPFLKLGETIFESDFPTKKLSSFQAGLSRHWQDKLNLLIKIRTKNTEHWARAINSKFRIENSKLPLLRFPIKINERQTLKKIQFKSDEQGLGLMKAYPDSINNIKEIKYCFKDQNLNAATIAKQLLTLPVHNFISQADAAKINKLFYNEFRS